MVRKTLNLNMFLLHKNESFKKYLEKDLHIKKELQIDRDSFGKNEQITINSGKIFVIEEILKHPYWLDIINHFKKGNNKVNLDNRTYWTALVFIKFNEFEETLLLAFGRTSGILKTKYIINDFGIETAKQIVNSQNLNHIKVQSFDDRQTQIQKQSIKLLNENHLIEPFKLNSIYDFIGNTRIDNLDVNVGGSDNLKVKGKLNIKKDFLNLILALLTTYKNRHTEEPQFKVKGNIKPITEQKIKNKLNKELHNKLVRLFNSNNIDGNSMRNLYINPDKDINHDNFLGYNITSIGLPTDKIFRENELDQFYIFERIQKALPKKDEDSIVRKLNNIKVHLKYEDSSENEVNSFYNSLYYEVTKEYIKYILLNGKWYAIDNNFYQSISNKIDDIDTNDVLDYIFYDTAIHKEESCYNQSLASKVNVLELDRNLYSPSEQIRELASISPHSTVEIADILNYDSISQTLQFIHIKRLEGGASKIIHTFTQAKTSAQLYAYDKANIIKFINKERCDIGFEPISFSDIKKTEVVVSFIIPSNKKDKVSYHRELFTILERISLYETINIIYPLGFELKLNFIDSNL